MNTRRKKGIFLLQDNMQQGFVKLYRSTLKNELMDNDNNCLIVFVKLLMLVDRRTGSFVTGRKKLAAIMNMKPTTVYAALKRLERRQQVLLSSDKTKTTIHICKWSDYQQQNDKPMTSQRLQSDTKQEREEEKNITNVEVPSNLRLLHEKICTIFGKNINQYKLSDKRRQVLKVRLKDTGEDNILKACKAISESNFHMGENDRAWVADPYWCISSVEKAELWAQKSDGKGYQGKLSEMEI